MQQNTENMIYIRLIDSLSNGSLLFDTIIAYSPDAG